MSFMYYKLGTPNGDEVDVLAESLNLARQSLRTLMGGNTPIGNQVTSGSFFLDFTRPRVYAKFRTTGVLNFMTRGPIGQYEYVMLSIEGDGVNIPIFTGIVKWGGSLDFNKAEGAVNHIMFFGDGVTPFYTIVPAL